MTLSAPSERTRPTFAVLHGAGPDAARGADDQNPLTGPNLGSVAQEMKRGRRPIDCTRYLPEGRGLGQAEVVRIRTDVPAGEAEHLVPLAEARHLAAHRINDPSHLRAEPDTASAAQ